MNIYIFVIGNNYKLSVIEILNYFYNFNIKIIDKIFTNKILILKIDQKINCKDIINVLGGTIKIGELLTEENNINKNIFENIILNNSIKNKKINFGFNVYDIYEPFNCKIKKIGLAIKNDLKLLGYNSRFVVNNNNINILSSVTTQKNNLIKENGFEFLITKLNHKYLIFKILAIQDFEDYSFRDFGRPNRDSHSGMLPPKLCKMMINFSDFINNKNINILDPFCGSGTIISELLLLGYNNIFASDISDSAIENSKKNIKWIINKYNLSNKKVHIFKEDVKDINKKIDRNFIDLIITEPYLGPANLKISDIFSIQKNIRYLEELYLSSFKNFYEILNYRGEIIIIFPVFKVLDNKKINFLRLNIIDQIKDIGFIEDNFKKLNIENSSEMLYSREDQKILREIHKFIKK
ncbi:MAG TPA: methyltransferase domain-containing protein [Bacteroidales bacterium]|nr:methyltransferase domain-containing protein [Bacteroidales bacterium]HOC96247.1 methyltransferase domain-containing protein [bacterium]HQL11412.1 methyltransferase domain-containing protein [bacterium]